jgi:OmpA-OmpF porin, OOP family
MRRIGLLFGILMLWLLPQAAHAGIVVGASAGEAGIDLSEAEFDESDFSWKAFGGYRFVKYFGLRAEYLDLGNPEANLPTIGDINVAGTAWNFAAEGVLPIGEHFELFATLGYVFWEFDTNDSGVLSDDHSGEDVNYGLGAAIIIGEHFGIRGEWQRFEAGNEIDVDVLTAGVDFRF